MLYRACMADCDVTRRSSVDCHAIFDYLLCEVEIGGQRQSCYLDRLSVLQACHHMRVRLADTVETPLLSGQRSQMYSPTQFLSHR